MNKEEAERQIVELVQSIGAVRTDSSIPEKKKVKLIAALDKDIKTLKEITGPRHIIGKARL